MLDKLLNSFKKKAESQQTGALEMYTKKLGDIVYDEELVKELAPIFAKMSSQEGFDKIFELLESKERQIESISGGEWNKEGDEKETIISNKQEDSTKTQSAEDILAEMFKSK